MDLVTRTEKFQKQNLHISKNWISTSALGGGVISETSGVEQITILSPVQNLAKIEKSCRLNCSTTDLLTNTQMEKLSVECIG